MAATPKKVTGLTLLCVAVFAAVSALIQTRRGSFVQRDAVDARRTLHEQGFKTDLADFDFHTDAAMRAREVALTIFGSTVHQAMPDEGIELMPPASDDAVIVVWKQDWLKAESETFHWPDLSDALEANRRILDDACTAALSGPIRFNLEASHGAAMLLKHLASSKRLSESLNSRMLLELHEGHPDAAWTNLLAAARLVTAWEPEPAAVSHQVRFALTSLAFAATWQALQAHQFSDAQLERLQTEWQSVNFFTNLPETVAFNRASAVDLCQRERLEPITAVFSWNDFFKEVIKSPRSAWANLKSYKNLVRYRAHDSYVDEKNLLLFYRDRETELRAATRAANWLQMQIMPGVVTKAAFTSPFRSRWQTMMNMHEITAAFMNRGTSFLGRAAEAEVRRGIILTALALERYHLNHGRYPSTLEGLSNAFQKSAPIDFMDGKPLRYRLTDDGSFVLYSVGLDGSDDGGRLATRDENNFRAGRFSAVATVNLADIVWPRPASIAEVTDFAQTEKSVVAQKTDDDEEREATFQWQHTEKRQANAIKLLAADSPSSVPDVYYLGRPLSAVLLNTNAAGTNRMTLLEMLTLKQMATGAEPETITFEVPVAYDVVTNLGDFGLMMDPDYKTGDEEGCGPQQAELLRTENGNCRFVWHTIYEIWGMHAIQAALFLKGHDGDDPAASGPLVPFVITNLCQFTAASANFDKDLGATWYARLPEPNGRFTVECNTTNGTLLKTISGTTTNGFLKVHWDLVNDHGQRFDGDNFDSVIQLTLPDSGREQTLRGP